MCTDRLFFTTENQFQHFFAARLIRSIPVVYERNQAFYYEFFGSLIFASPAKYLYNSNVNVNETVSIASGISIPIIIKFVLLYTWLSDLFPTSLTISNPGYNQSQKRNTVCYCHTDYHCKFLLHALLLPSN